METPPIKSYFDTEIQDAERELMFSRGVRYVGHRLMVPEVNDYIVPDTLDGRYAIFHQQDGHDLISNVCPHRQALLLEGSGNTRSIVCKVHCWSFSSQGKLRATPHFTGQGQRDLERRPLSEWCGLLFDGRPPDLDLAEAGLSELVNFDGYVYAGAERAVLDFNWKTFAELYLEDYHVLGIHPGLKRYIRLDNLEWRVGKDYSIQYASLTRDLDRAGSEASAAWQQAVKRRFGHNLPRYGALWLYLYPNIMIEWYPGVMLISTVHPVHPQQCINHVEYYFPREIVEEDPAYVAAARRWLAELAEEDAGACLRQERGRRALYQQRHEVRGAVDPFLEKGVGEFYGFLSDAYRGLSS